MSDLFKDFSFDIQRFADEKNFEDDPVKLSDIGASTATKSEGKYYWSDGVLVADSGKNSSVVASGSVKDDETNKVSYKSISSVSSIILNGADSHKLTLASDVNAFITGLGSVSSLSIVSISGSSSTTLLNGLAFSGATLKATTVEGTDAPNGNAIFGYEKGGASISLVTNKASLTLAKGNTTIGSGNDTTPVTLTINGTDFTVQNTGFTYLHTNTSNTLTLLDASSVSGAISISGGPSSIAKDEDAGTAAMAGYVIPAQSTKKTAIDQVLTIGETQYKFVNNSGSAAFVMDTEGSAVGFNFVGTGDKLYLTEDGLGLVTLTTDETTSVTTSNASYGSKYTAFNSSIDISGASNSTATAYLEMTGTTEFVLGGLTAKDLLVLGIEAEEETTGEGEDTEEEDPAYQVTTADGSSTVTSGVIFAATPADTASGNPTATAGGSVVFDAKTAKLISITAESGAVAQVVGNSKFTINDQTVDIKLVQTENNETVTLTGASLLVEYNYTDADKPILDISGVIGGSEDEATSEETTPKITAATITSAGGAAQLNIGTDLETIKINKTTFTLNQTTIGSAADATPYNSAFVMDGNDATGFIFNTQGDTPGTTQLIFAKGVPSDFTLYAGDSDEGSEVEGMPTISGNAEVAVGLKAAENNSYTTSLVVGQGAVLTFTNGTVIDFSKIGKNDYAQVLFDEDGVHYITGFAGDSDDDISTAVTALATATSSAFTEDSKIVVTGGGVSSATDGIIFGASTLASATAANYIATANGNYTYVYGEDGEVTITLTDANDTIYSSGAAGQVSLVADSGTINYDEEIDYAYTNSKEAYFTADSLTGALNGFVFMAKNDAVTLTEDAPETFQLYYVPNGEEDPDELELTPTVSDGDRTITMTRAYSSNKPAQFVLSGIEAEATATFGDDDTDTYEFSAEGGTVIFTPEGVTGFTTESGTVTLDETAAGHLDTSEENATFTIDGKEVNIAAEELTDDELVYNRDDYSLLGLGTGSRIIEAGDITKIYVTGTDATYTFVNGEEELAFTITASGDDAETAPYFTLSDGVPSEFTFAQENDALTIPETFDASNLVLHDGDDSEAIKAPVVTDANAESDDQAQVAFTITKTETDDGVECFSISAEELQGKKITFGDDSTLTFNTVADNDEVEIYFDKDSGALLNLVGLETAEDEVAIAGATEAVTIDGHEISIVGGAFIYKMQDASTPSIINIEKDTQVVYAEDITEFWTTNDATLGNGEFTFGEEGASSVFTIAGMSAYDADGIRFDYDGEKVTGVGSVEGVASVKGAFFDTLGTEFSFNDSVTSFIAASDSATYTFSGTSLAGLVDGDEVSTPGAISDFITVEEGQFTFSGAGMSIVGDEQVTFVVKTSGALSAIKGLDVAGASALGNFNDLLSVNGASVQVTGDDTLVAVYSNGTASGIAAIGSLSGKVDIVKGVGSIGADGDAQLTFSFAGNDEAFSIAGNSEAETWFTFNEAGTSVAQITGIDAGESVTGSFSNAIMLNDTATIQVLNDDDLTVASVAGGGLSIFNLTGGASIKQATGTMVAKTDSIKGGEIFTFADGASVAISGTDSDGVDFTIENGILKKISGLSSTASVSGDLNDVIIGNEPKISVVGTAGENKNLAYKEGLLSGIVNGDTVYLADNVTTIQAAASGVFYFANGGQSFKTDDKTGLDFLVTSDTTGVSVTAIDSLDAGAKLSGNLGALSAINGASVMIENDDSFAVVGKNGGIATITELSGGASVIYAGGAASAITDKEGEFSFFGSQNFKTAGDSIVTFLLDGQTVTGIAGLSGSVEGEFDKAFKINDQTFEIAGDSDGKFTVFGNSAATGIVEIDGVGGTSTVEIVNAGGASTIKTDAAGTFVFASRSFKTDDDALTFALNGTTVIGIDELDAIKFVTGNFDNVTINGKNFDVTDDDEKLTVYGKDGGIAKIADVDGDATIIDVGGASLVVTKKQGEFTFAGHSNPFMVDDDDKIEFVMDTDAAALVKGVKGFGDSGAARITGELGAVSINDESIAITGDKDSIFSYAVDANKNAILGGVSGTEVTIDGTGGASQVEVTGDGKYIGLFGGTYTLSGRDNLVIFGQSSIADLDETIEGAFANTTVNGKKIAISGDDTIGLVGGTSGVEEIFELSGSATISAADGTITATTDAIDGTAQTFTFANGVSIAVSGKDDDGVQFVMVDGVLTAINSLSSTATVTGALSGILINEDPTEIIVKSATDPTGYNTNLTYANGILNGIVDGDTVVSADSVTLIKTTAASGVFYFANGSQSFTTSDTTGLDFAVTSDDTGVTVTAIDSLDAGATLVGALNEFAINGASFGISGDDDGIFGVVGKVGGISAITKVGGTSGITVTSAGGASLLVSDLAGTFVFASGQSFVTEGDDIVEFTLSGESVTAIGALSGAVKGEFTDGKVTVNGEKIVVLDDADGIIVHGDGTSVAKISDVDAGSNVTDWGNAKLIESDGTGVYTIGDEKFTVGGDSKIGFDMVVAAGLCGVNGVVDFEDGTLDIDNFSTGLAVNGASLKFESDTDIHLTIVDSKVVSLSGITGGVSGLQDATVAATAAISVNGEFIDITDDNNSFNVIVAGGSINSVTDVTGDATVNVTNGTIVADGDGDFFIGGESYTFSDNDDDFTFYTDENQKLVGVDDLSGTLEIVDGEIGSESSPMTINGEDFWVANGASSAGLSSIKVTTDGSEITAVDGLENYDSVGGDLDNAAIAMLGTSATVKGEGSFLTVNGNEYQLLGDEDGIVVTGSNEITDLDENASLLVGEAGSYEVNGVSTDLNSLKAGDIIIGGEDPYVYDPKNILVTSNTPVKDIENMLGTPDFDNAENFGGDDVNHETATTEDDPLTKEQSDALFDTEDPADLDQPAEIWLDNADNKETQTLPLQDTEFAKKVTLYTGPQSVEFNDEFGNEVIIDKEATGEKNITFNSTLGSMAIIDGKASLGNEVNITGGSGNDTLFVRNNVDVNFDMSAGGADIIAMFASANARVSLEGYNYATGAGIKIDEREAKNIANAIGNGFISFGDGFVQIGMYENCNAKAFFNGNTGTVGGTLVNLFNPNRVKQTVGFTNSAGGSIDGSAATDDLIFLLNKEGKKSGGSTVTGGSGNDTAFAGAGDNINLGDGENLVSLESNDNREGATITIGAGRTTISNMNNTLNEKHGDVLNVNLDIAEIKFDGSNLIVESEDFYAIAPDADKHGALNYSDSSSSSSNLASSSDTEVDDLIAGNNYVDQIVVSNGTTWKGSFAADGEVMQVESDEDVRANYYKGENSGVTFAGYAGDAVVDLANDGVWITNSSIGGNAARFEGVVSLKAGAAGSNDQFKGSANSETLMAGQGDASLYGDGGSNLLVGYNGLDGDKEGQTTFLVLGNADGAANTITGFEFVSDDNYTDTEKVTADKLEIDLNTNHVDRIDISDGTNVLIEVINNTNGKVEKALIEGAVGRDVMLGDVRDNSSLVAKVDTDSVDFDRYATFYYATEKNATLLVDDANIQDEAIVWLGGETGYEFVGDFRVINATGFSGKAQLAGNSLNNTILAGSGETSLWGGKFGDDVMYSGTGKDTFFYALGNGTDTVEGAKDGDVVNLAVALENISETEIAAESISIKFNDGGSLTVNDGGANVSFQVQGDNNSTYYADRDSNTWVKRA